MISFYYVKRGGGRAEEYNNSQTFNIVTLLKFQSTYNIFSTDRKK